MDDKTIIDACAYLGLTTGETQDPTRVLAYVEALRDLKNPEHFAKAILLLRDRCEHFPKIPEIREAYREVLTSAPRRPELGEGGLSESERHDLAVQMRAHWEYMWGEGMGSSVGVGSCGDCGVEGDVWMVGERVFCRGHAQSRLKAAARLDVDSMVRDMPT